MSKTTVKINRIKKRLDDISGLDGYFVQDRLDKIEKLVEEIDKHADNEIKGTIFEEEGGERNVKNINKKRKGRN